MNVLWRLRSSAQVQHRLGKLVIPGLLIAALGGICSSANAAPPPPEADVEALGVGWSGARPAPADAPLPPSSLSRLEMSQAVVWASQRNPVLQQSYEQLVATQNSLGATYATWWPILNQSLNGGPYGGRSYYNYAGAFSGGVPSPGPYQNQKAFLGSYFQAIGQFDLTWNLLDPARAPSLWQAKYRVRQAADTYVIALRDNRLQTEQAFVALQQAWAQVLAGQQIVANDELVVRLTMARFRLGSATRLDLAKQTSVLRGDQASLARARQDVEVAQASLADLMATREASLLVPAEPLAALGSWPHSLEETSRSALAYRKVLEQKLMDVKINEAQAQIALSIYRPTIQLVNSLLWTKGVGFTGQGPSWVASARSDLWDASALVQISFTGFDGGQARMTAEASRRQARAAEASYRAAVNQVLKDVETFHAQVLHGRDVVVYSSQKVRAAREALRLQTLRFNAGYGTVTDVVQAQQDLTSGVQSFVDDLAAYNVALVSLARASGLSYQSDEQLTRRIGTPLDNLRLPSPSAVGSGQRVIR